MFYSRLEVNLGVFVCESDDPPPCAVDDKDSSQSVAADNHMLDLRPSPLFPEAESRVCKLIPPNTSRVRVRLDQSLDMVVTVGEKEVSVLWKKKELGYQTASLQKPPNFKGFRIAVCL